jgi:hypothetical protein
MKIKQLNNKQMAEVLSGDTRRIVKRDYMRFVKKYAKQLRIDCVGIDPLLLFDKNATQIKSLDDLLRACLAKKCVSNGWCFKRTPAAFIYFMQASSVHRLIQSGLFIYEPKPKTKAPFKTAK